MMGLEEIKWANEHPEEFRRSRDAAAQILNPTLGELLDKGYGKVSVPVSAIYFDGVHALQLWMADLRFRHQIAAMLSDELTALRAANPASFDRLEQEVAATMDAMTALTPCSKEHD